MRGKLAELAAHMLEAAPGDIEIRDGFASIIGDSQIRLPVADIAGFAYFGGPARPPDMAEPALTATRSYDPPQTYSNGCVVAVVEVDPKTGIVSIEEIVAVEDCGTMLNPMIVDGQVAGAIAQGIGSALFEELVYAEDGQLLTGSLMDYLYPSTMEVPPMTVRPSNERLFALTEGGSKGSAKAERLPLRPRSSTRSPTRWLRSGWPSTGCRSVHRTSGRRQHARAGDFLSEPSV